MFADYHQQLKEKREKKALSTPVVTAPCASNNIARQILEAKRFKQQQEAAAQEHSQQSLSLHHPPPKNEPKRAREDSGETEASKLSRTQKEIPAVVKYDESTGFVLLSEEFCPKEIFNREISKEETGTEETSEESVEQNPLFQNREFTLSDFGFERNQTLVVTVDVPDRTGSWILNICPEQHYCGTEILFHLNPRFTRDGKTKLTKKYVVCNDRQVTWSKTSALDQTCNPASFFGKAVELTIQIRPACFIIFVDDNLAIN